MSHFQFRKQLLSLISDPDNIQVMANSNNEEYSTSDESSSDSDCAAAFMIVQAAAAAATYAAPLYDKIPYHTSALSGEAWVLELLQGHPKRIRCELGVHKHVFYALHAELCTMGLAPARDVTSEEQLAIFLYKCVTGLSVEHVGERFQHSNDTISKYAFIDDILVIKMNSLLL